MKISLLGTSHGVPEPGRFCSCSLIETGGVSYLIDAGAPVMDLFHRKGVDVNSLRAVFITHMHGDHTDGLVQLCDLMNWYYQEAQADIYLPDLMGAEYIKGLVSALEGQPLDENRMRFHLMDENTLYEDEHIRITPFPTKHIELGLRPSFAYLVEAEGKKVIFSGDLSGGLKGDDFPQYALDHKIDLMILEMAHFTPEMAHPWLARCKAERILLNHVNRWHEKGPGILALNGRFGYPIRMAAEGEEIIL